MSTAACAARVADGGSDGLRSDLYGLLASPLAQPSSADRINQLGTLTAAGEMPAVLAQALKGLKAAAVGTDTGAVGQEYADLFIGLAERRLVVP